MVGGCTWVQMASTGSANNIPIIQILLRYVKAKPAPEPGLQTPENTIMRLMGSMEVCGELVVACQPKSVV